MARPASGPAVMVPRPDSSALPGDDQLAGITIDPERPLLISDADEVLFAFMDGFERHLHDNAKSFSWASFRLNGNIIDDETDEPVEPQAVRSLVYSFFERHTRTLAAVDKAADCLDHLSRRLQIVVLSNIWPEFRCDRAYALRTCGMPYPIIANHGSKAPAVAHLASRTNGPVFFVDDIPMHHRDVSEIAADIIRIHYVSNARLAALLGVAQDCHYSARDWHGIRDYIDGRLDEA